METRREYFPQVKSLNSPPEVEVWSSFHETLVAVLFILTLVRVSGQLGLSRGHPIPCKNTEYRQAPLAC